MSKQVAQPTNLHGRPGAILVQEGHWIKRLDVLRRRLHADHPDRQHAFRQRRKWIQLARQIFGDWSETRAD